jgi:hypothetical protein
VLAGKPSPDRPRGWIGGSQYEPNAKVCAQVRAAALMALHTSWPGTELREMTRSAANSTAEERGRSMTGMNPGGAEPAVTVVDTGVMGSAMAAI